MILSIEYSLIFIFFILVFLCGLKIFNLEEQDVHCGGSGCGCSATVFAGYIYQKLLKKEFSMKESLIPVWLFRVGKKLEALFTSPSRRPNVAKVRSTKAGNLANTDGG